MHQLEMVHLICNLLDHSTYKSHRVAKTAHNGKDEVYLDIMRPGISGAELVVLKVNEDDHAD